MFIERERKRERERERERDYWAFSLFTEFHGSIVVRKASKGFAGISCPKREREREREIRERDKREREISESER